MKPTYARRYRRRSSPSRESTVFKKDNQLEQPFFSNTSPQSFFKPNAAIMRKCEKCESDDKSVNRMGENKEEEKPVQKMDEKKEEDKSVQKMGEKKEEEKPVQKMGEKKEEEKPVQKMDEKKEEEKPVQKMDEKKEEDKSVQKMGEKKEEEKPVQKMDEKKEEDKSVQKEEEENVSKKQLGPTGQGANQTSAYIHSLPGKGSSLPNETRQFFKQRMGYDFSQVRIHTDQAAAKSAKELHARAYAVDNHIVFNKGQYDPGSAEGKKLLAHELTHVAQQKGNGKQLLQSTSELEVNRKEAASQPLHTAGKATHSHAKKAYGCEGVDVEGHTEANYTDSFSSTGSTKSSKKCDDCDETECVTATGTLKSVFKANPVVTLPSVPDGLTECESKAVAKFIRTTLKNHEQQHVAAFNTYNATIKTPYKFTGCQANLDGYIQSLHDGINAKRLAAANAKSDKLDPFNRPIPCNCKE